jgi:hypothetical protein
MAPEVPFQVPSSLGPAQLQARLQPECRARPSTTLQLTKGLGELQGRTGCTPLPHCLRRRPPRSARQAKNATASSSTTLQLAKSLGKLQSRAGGRQPPLACATRAPTPSLYAPPWQKTCLGRAASSFGSPTSHAKARANARRLTLSQATAENLHRPSCDAPARPSAPQAPRSPAPQARGKDPDRPPLHAALATHSPRSPTAWGRVGGGGLTDCPAAAHS